MAINFSSVAKKASNESVVRKGRKKADLQSVVSAYPEGVTIISAEISHTTEVDRKTDDTIVKEFAVIAIKEESELYFNGGSALTAIVRAWLEQYNGDVEAMNEDLEKSGGVKVNFDFTRLTNGNNYTAVTVIG